MPEVKKLDLNDPDTQSADIVAGNVEALKALFPDAFTEGKIDFDVLKGLLGAAVDEHDEKYGLNWHGKRRARQIALTPSTGTLLPCPEESVDWDTTQNLMIEGDNLEVLKLLQKSYAGKVKLIYIDPPYNTGKDFIYPDDFTESIKNYLELTGQVEGGRKLTSNTETSGRFHTDWMNMMYPRLKLARTLLHPNGIIFASIDDSELNNFTKMFDEIFGEERRLGIITVVSNLKGRSDDKYFATAHNHLLAYGGASYVSPGVPLPEEYLDEYPEVAADGRRFRLQGLRKRGAGARRIDRPNMFYSFFVDPKSKMVSLDRSDAYNVEVLPRLSDGQDGRWRWGKETASERISDLIGGLVGPEQRWDVFQVDYAETSDGAKRIKPKTIWMGPEFANEAGTLELKRLFGNAPFDTAKPIGLLRYCIEQTMDKDALIMDFFAGSGTTGHAVFKANAEDNGQRRFVLVQLPEVIDRKDYKKISEITAERLRRAGKAVRDENPLFAGDTGFRVFKLASSNIRAWEPNPADLGDSLLKNAEHLVEGRKEQDVLYELLLKLGLDLCVPIEAKTIAGKSVHAIGGGALIVCLADGLTKDVIEPLAAGIVAWRATLAPAVDTRVVFKDSGFADDIAKTNMAAILNQNGIADVRSL